MIRHAKPGDEAAIDAFLEPHSANSMFLRSNLAKFGLGLEDDHSDDPRATRFWVFGDDSIQAVFGRSNAGFLMAQVPDNRPEQWAAFRDVLEGQKVVGVTSASDQVETALSVFGLQDASFSLKRAEPHYKLALSNLKCPVHNGRLRPVVSDDQETIIDWIFDYDTGALGAPANDATYARAMTTAKVHVNSPNHRILEVEGQPVAKTAFNATLPDMVQIGGVYTPPPLRSNGYARTAVALHLLEARENGVEAAILFASGKPACRAYEALGFERIGSYTLAILSEPQVVRAQQ